MKAITMLTSVMILGLGVSLYAQDAPEIVEPMEPVIDVPTEPTVPEPVEPAITEPIEPTVTEPAYQPRPGDVPRMAREMLGGQPRAAEVQVNDRLWRELEAHGIDVERFLERLNDPGEAGQSLRNSLINRGLLVSRMRHELNATRQMRRRLEATVAEGQVERPLPNGRGMRPEPKDKTPQQADFERFRLGAPEHAQRFKEQRGQGVRASEIRQELHQNVSAEKTKTPRGPSDEIRNRILGMREMRGKNR